MFQIEVFSDSPILVVASFLLRNINKNFTEFYVIKCEQLLVNHGCFNSLGHPVIDVNLGPDLHKVVWLHVRLAACRRGQSIWVVSRLVQLNELPTCVCGHYI